MYAALLTENTSSMYLRGWQSHLPAIGIQLTDIQLHEFHIMLNPIYFCDFYLVDHCFMVVGSHSHQPPPHRHLCGHRGGPEVGGTSAGGSSIVCPSNNGGSSSSSSSSSSTGSSSSSSSSSSNSSTGSSSSSSSNHDSHDSDDINHSYPWMLYHISTS